MPILLVALVVIGLGLASLPPHPPPPPPGSVPLSSQTPKPNWWKPGYTDWAKSGLDSAMARIIRLDRQTLILQSLILVVRLVLLIKL